MRMTRNSLQQGALPRSVPVTDADSLDLSLARHIQSLGGYLEVRLLEDGSIAALGDLLFTRAVYLGCHDSGWSRRFCYTDRSLANQVFASLESEDDVLIGWTASREPTSRMRLATSSVATWSAE
jgi:hypothetical protein